MKILSMTIVRIGVIALPVTSHVLAQDRLVAPPDERTVYRETIFLTTPFTPHYGSDWRVWGGTLEVSPTGKNEWRGESGSFLPRAVVGNWQPIKILGAPAVASKEVKVKVGIHDEYPTVEVTLLNEKVYQVGQKMSELPSGDIAPEIGVFVSAIDRTGHPERVASFVVDPSPFEFRISKIAAVKGNLLALVFGSRHHFVNKLLLFDTERSAVIAQTSFSELRYVPAEQSLWVVPPQPNTDDQNEVVHGLEGSVKPTPILSNGKVSSKFSNLEGIEKVK